MANLPPIKIKRSTVSGTVPSPSDLLPGELAINTADNKIYTVDNSNNLVYVGNNSVPTVAALLSLTNVQAGEIYSVQDSKTIWMYDGTDWIVNEPDVDFADASVALLTANFNATTENGKFARVGSKKYKADVGTWVEQAVGAGAVFAEYQRSGDLKADYDLGNLTQGGIYFVKDTKSFFLVTSERLEPATRNIQEYSTWRMNNHFPPSLYKGMEALLLDSDTQAEAGTRLISNGVAWNFYNPLDGVYGLIDDWEDYKKFINSKVYKPALFTVSNVGHNKVGPVQSTGDIIGAQSAAANASFTSTYGFANPIDGAAGRFNLTCSRGNLSNYEINRAWNGTSDPWATSGTNANTLTLNFDVISYPRQFTGNNWNTNQRYDSLTMTITYFDGTTEVVQQLNVGAGVAWNLSFNAAQKRVTQIVMAFTDPISGNPGGLNFRLRFWQLSLPLAKGLHIFDSNGAIA